VRNRKREENEEKPKRTHMFVAQGHGDGIQRKSPDHLEET